MNIQQFAHDLAARIPEMAKDNPINNANVIANLLFHECSRCDEPDKECNCECAELRRRITALEVENHELLLRCGDIRDSVTHGRGGMISPMGR